MFASFLLAEQRAFTPNEGVSPADAIAGMEAVPVRLLLVEDSDPLRWLFARVLKRNGFTVHEAADGQAALDSLAGFEPQLIVTDMMMPVMDGIELIHRLRAMPSLAAVPMVVITASASPEHESKARAAGAADFIAKPVDGETLVRRLAAYSLAGE